jgi:hypothetical protein
VSASFKGMELRGRTYSFINCYHRPPSHQTTRRTLVPCLAGFSCVICYGSLSAFVRIRVSYLCFINIPFISGVKHTVSGSLKLLWRGGFRARKRGAQNEALSRNLFHALQKSGHLPFLPCYCISLRFALPSQLLFKDLFLFILFFLS